MWRAVRPPSLALLVLAAAASLAADFRPGMKEVTWLGAGGQGGGPPGPVFSVAGLRVWEAGQWVPVPAQLPVGVAVDFAVEVRNVGSAAGTAALTAVAEVMPLSENPLVHYMSGAATVVIAPGAAHFLQLGPAWLPLAAGWYRISGAVEESGVEIGSFSETREVVAGADPCPVPAVALP